MAPIISIGIPTYNGAKRIGSTLESVARQLTPDISPYIEIVISDNNSTDNTDLVVAKCTATFPCVIRYSKNQNNIGYDRNVDNLFSLATGNYVWLLADDDLLQQEALSKVLSTLNAYNNLKLLQLNFQTFDANLSHVVHEIKMDSDVLCNDAESFLINSRGRYGQLSALIFSREAWINVRSDLDFGTNYIHMHMLLKILIKGGRSYIFKDFLVMARTGSKNFGTSGDSLILTPLGGAKIFIQMRALGYSKHISRILLLGNRKYISNIIPYAKNEGIDHPIKVIRSLLAVHNCPEGWFCWLPIILIPSNFYRYMYSFLKMLRTYYSLRRE